MDTISLISDDAVAALRVPGLVPDPDAAAGYLAATGHDRTRHAARSQVRDRPRPGRWATAACGATARVDWPGITYDPAGSPCLVCLWHAAIGTGATEREIRRITPAPDTAAALSSAGVDSLIAVKIARAILADDRISDAVTAGVPDPQPVRSKVTLLAHLSAHAPGIALDEECSEGECTCRTDIGYCPGTPICWGCTPTWHDPWTDRSQALTECLVQPPCSVIQAFAAHYGISQATSPYDIPASRRG